MRGRDRREIWLEACPTADSILHEVGLVPVPEVRIEEGWVPATHIRPSIDPGNPHRPGKKWKPNGHLPVMSSPSATPSRMHKR
jgi:hypothetical protein